MNLDTELASLVSLLDTPEFRKRAKAALQSVAIEALGDHRHCAICNRRTLVTDMAFVCFADRLDQVSRGGA